MQPNPILEEAGGVKLAENEKEMLLLELFPLVAKNYLTNVKKKAYEAKVAAEQAEQEKVKATEQAKAAEAKKAAEAAKVVAQPITGNVVEAPLPGRILEILVKVGDEVKIGQAVVVLEAMKMENSITSNYHGKVKQILISEGEAVAANAAMIEIE